MSAKTALPTGAAKGAAVEEMFDRIAPGYDRMNRVISMGMDRRWRRTTVDALGLRRGSTVLDVACGTGDLCNDLAAAGHLAIGVDFSAGMLAAARTQAPLLRADATRLPVHDGAVDGVVCGFALRNFVSLEPFFAECARVLSPGGRLAALDAAEPERTLLRAGHTVWFRWAVPLLGRVLARDAAAYSYLPASTAYLPAPPALLDLVRGAGFRDVRRRTLMGGAVQIITATAT